jgi:hypothetical protein
MRRREFIAVFGLAVGWPVVTKAQQSRTPVIGLLSGFAAATSLDDRFHESCHKRGIHLSFLTPI